MELTEITELEQLPGYYKEKSLTTTDAKVEHLMATMGVKAIQCEYGADPKDALICLEDDVIDGSWKGYLERKLHRHSLKIARHFSHSSSFREQFM